jgi:hypothetical protein
MPPHALNMLLSVGSFSTSVVLGVSLWMSVAAQAQTTSDSIYDYMVMDVCVDAAGITVDNLTPVDPACLHRRNIAPGELPPYHLHNFPREQDKCADRLGSIAKDNIPVARNGVTRIVSFYNHGVDTTCPGAAKRGAFGRLGNPGDGGSVQWHDGKYGYIMGSWSPIALSYFVTRSCADNPSSSERFARGWIVGAERIPAELNQFGYGDFFVKLVAGGLGAGNLACPIVFNRYLAAWVRVNFLFRSGLALDTLISDHFSRSSADGMSPGAAQQFERTYWTKEFGLTRWEKWGRDDWVHPRSRKTVNVLAKQRETSSRCNAAFWPQGRITPDLIALQPPSDSGRGMLQVPSTGVVHEWRMTLCEDYTNIVKDPLRKASQPWGEVMDSAFWAP